MVFAVPQAHHTYLLAYLGPTYMQGTYLPSPRLTCFFLLEFWSFSLPILPVG